MVLASGEGSALCGGAPFLRRHLPGGEGSRLRAHARPVSSRECSALLHRVSGEVRLPDGPRLLLSPGGSRNGSCCPERGNASGDYGYCMALADDTTLRPRRLALVPGSTRTHDRLGAGGGTSVRRPLHVLLLPRTRIHR